MDIQHVEALEADYNRWNHVFSTNAVREGTKNNGAAVGNHLPGGRTAMQEGQASEPDSGAGSAGDDGANRLDAERTKSGGMPCAKPLPVPTKRLKVVLTFFSRLERNPPRCGPRPEPNGPEPGLMRTAEPTMMQTCTRRLWI